MQNRVWHIRRMWKVAITSGISAVVLATQSIACAFHTYAPRPTLVDRLLASEHVVLARANPTNPFSYVATEALEGELDHVSIPLLVDSVTRRRFSADENARVLFARDGPYGPWEKLAFVDAAFHPILDSILERLPAWELGDDLERFGFFAELANSPVQEIQTLALRELDQADYSILRQLNVPVDVQDISPQINVPSQIDLKPIRILLLGLSKDETVVPWLQAGLLSSARVEGAFLGAYATALIENRGTAGIDWVAENVFANAEISAAAREQVIEALAIHSVAGDTVAQARIREVIDQHLSADASLGPAIARQYGFRADWTFSGQLKELLASRSFNSAADIIAVSQYVALADEFE